MTKAKIMITTIRVVALGGRFFGKEVKVIIIENEEKKEF
jgi:hypothetical protein